MKVISVAIRGRPANSTVQQFNSSTVQQLELGSDKYSFCLTTVQKDSLILIREVNDKGKRSKNL